MGKFSDFYNTPLKSKNISALDDLDIGLDNITLESEDEPEEIDDADNGVTTAQFLAQAEGDGTQTEEDRRIGDELARIATPIMAKEVLDEDECEKFKESVDSFDAITESFFTERTIVKMDKKAKLAKLRKIAILTIAKEKKDPLYPKLVKMWDNERKIERYFEKKYGNYANKKVREYLTKAKNSNSGFVKKVASRIAITPKNHPQLYTAKATKVTDSDIAKTKINLR